MPTITAIAVFLLALALQAWLSGLRPLWPGLVLPALHELLVLLTMAGYRQAYEVWQPDPAGAFLQGSIPAIALLILWAGVRLWKRHWETDQLRRMQVQDLG